MRALPSIHYSQKGALPDDAHPCPGQLIRAVPPARRRVSPPAILLPANRGTRHPIRSLDGSRRLRLHAFAHQLPVKLIAAALIHHRCLSSSASAAGSDNASRWSHVRGKLSQELGQIGQGRSHHD